MLGLRTGQNERAWQSNCVAEVAAASQYEPALQPPATADRPVTLQKYPGVQSVAALMPVLAQNAPTKQDVGDALPPAQYVPFGAASCMEEFEPAGQKYPALQLPVGALSADDAQYDPGVQGVNAERPVRLQKLPIGQTV